ncbi:MAG: polymorphic toxin type 23 domain-containing protein, partial [Muribaculum sp.]|nr:polymorphic toxin type 23 domain-containing protein [Muribaculum sp.]
SPDPYVQDPTLPQNFNRYSFCLNNPLLYCDQSGEWFGLDDLFVAAVGFAAGYFSNALSTGNWGWSSVKAGLTGAGMCWLGYNTAGLATGAITSATLTHAGQIGLSTLMSNITPSVNFKIGNVYLGISINPLIGVGTGGFTFGMGMGISAAYRDIYIGAGVGVGNNYWGWNTKATYRDWGSGYGRTYYNGGASPNGAELGKQSVGSISIFAPCGWSVNFSNDCIGDLEDRWRSNAVEISKGAFSIGTSVDTNWGKYDSTGGDKNVNGTYNGLSPNLGENRNDKGAWKVGKIHFAPLWVGVRNGAMSCRFGYSHVNIQDLTQNLIHKYLASTSYFLDAKDMRTGSYYYVGCVNPFNLWNY